MVDRQSPSGRISTIQGTVAIAATLAPATVASTATGSFTANAGTLTPIVGDVVALSPQANLGASISVAWSRVVANGIVAIAFGNSGISTSQAAVTFDTDVSRLG